MSRAPKRSEEVERELNAILRSIAKLGILQQANLGVVRYPVLLAALKNQGPNVDAENLHRMIKKMERNGWLKMAKSPSDQPRRSLTYRLTPLGKRALLAAQRHLSEFL
jgi:DNA-binding MarR family transcriptional regulator